MLPNMFGFTLKKHSKAPHRVRTFQFQPQKTKQNMSLIRLVVQVVNYDSF